MRKNFVCFHSPGTFVAEISERPIESWSPQEAVRIAANIEERHSSKPFGFQFVTKLCGEPVSDGEGGTLNVAPKEVERSGTYYITGELLFYHEVSDEHRILRDNMRCNQWPICIENNNSWRFTGPFRENDSIVDRDGIVIRRGDDEDLVEYRARKIGEWSPALSAPEFDPQHSGVHGTLPHTSERELT